MAISKTSKLIQVLGAWSPAIMVGLLAVSFVGSFFGINGCLGDFFLGLYVILGALFSLAIIYGAVRSWIDFKNDKESKRAAIL